MLRFEADGSASDYCLTRADVGGLLHMPPSATARIAEVAKTATYMRTYAGSNGFMTLLSDEGAP